MWFLRQKEWLKNIFRKAFFLLKLDYKNSIFNDYTGS